MPQNVEIKASYNGDLEDIKAVARNLAGKEPLELSQIDTFFQCSTGRLKLREIKGGEKPSQLIAYERPDEVAAKYSDYSFYHPMDAGSLKHVLTRSLGIIGEVRKSRLVYLVDQTRIHVDQVEGLGNFVELEKYIAAKDAQKLKEVLPSWCDWEKENPQALKLCLGEFLHLYGDYQREKLQGNPQFHALFEALERLKIKEYIVRELDCEVQIGMMLPVPRLTELAEISQNASHFAEQESVVWIKCISVGDELEVQSVMPSPLVLAALGESVVEFSRPRTVLEYFRTFVPQMQKKVEILVASKLKAFEVLSELGSTFPDHVTRVTREISQGTLSISLKFQSCNSSLTFDIAIPNEFPLRKPTIVKHVKDTEPRERKVEYEYNPGMSGEEIGREICYSIARILEELD
ncbi:unnamed protein product [Darwinula stevensoni]|uniref:CYTH domain-containing protein n=1 Tax=Darwinula stevensoni TaxID=69355 RepID=A0A7R9ADL5_9CRUS|nr:unnamed protein product [Darwinula stevensoni]CAG0901108.1 unnamed protein product [Darwinula stevensoni]